MSLHRLMYLYCLFPVVFLFLESPMAFSPVVLHLSPRIILFDVLYETVRHLLFKSVKDC